MTNRGAVAALAATVVMAGSMAAQTIDSATGPVVRHILAIDYGRIHPFQRSWDIVVVTKDSSTIIGRRDVIFSATMLSDSSMAWQLVETRTGMVPSIDSLLLAADLRPIRWRSTLGAAALDIAFSTDSMIGQVHLARSVSRFASAIPPDLIGPVSVVDVLLPLLPLALQWVDSANVAAVDMEGATIDPTEIAVVGEDSLVVDPALPARQVWVLTLRTARREAQLWVDRTSGEVLKSQWPLRRSDATLEYRPRSATLP